MAKKTILDKHWDDEDKREDKRWDDEERAEAKEVEVEAQTVEEPPPYDPLAPHTYIFLDDNSEVEDPATPGVPVVKMKDDTIELTDKQARAIIDSGIRIVGIETPEPPPP